MSDVDTLGGVDEVERLVGVFVDRMFDDFIIGFFFEGRDKQRIVAHEVEHALQILGQGGARYTGRPLGSVHRPLRINRGQFRRRLALLRTVLLEEGADPEVVERWISADRKLERVITDGTDCAAP